MQYVVLIIFLFLKNGNKLKWNCDHIYVVEKIEFLNKIYCKNFQLNMNRNSCFNTRYVKVKTYENFGKF